MIRLLGSIPKQPFSLAISGGVDSMAALHFLSQSSNRKNLRPIFFHHGTPTSDEALAFLEKEVPNLIWAKISVWEVKPPKVSLEEFWRENRYQFFHSAGTKPVLTVHHLDDCMETWIWGSIHGQPKTIPYRNKNVIRPFLLTPKAELVDYARRKGVKWIEDKSNADLKFQRNRIRHNIMPEVLKVNPGLAKVVSRKVRESYEALLSQESKVEERLRKALVRRLQKIVLKGK